MACQFLEVLDFADLIHLIDDPVQYGFNFLVRLFLKERALAFEPALVAQKLFFVGQVMKATGGRANPQAVNDILKKRLAG